MCDLQVGKGIPLKPKRTTALAVKLTRFQKMVQTQTVPESQAVQAEGAVIGLAPRGKIMPEGEHRGQAGELKDQSVAIASKPVAENVRLQIERSWDWLQPAP